MSIEMALNQCVTPKFRDEMRAIIQVESSGNPNAIALISKGRMLMQPQSREQAIKTIELLEQLDMHYAAGVAQINRVNFQKFGIEHDNMFDACKSVKTGEAILKGCEDSASKSFSENYQIQEAGWSCYYSGNFSDGFKKNGHKYSYVERVRKALGRKPPYGGANASRGGSPPERIADKDAGPGYVTSNVFEERGAK